MPKVSIIIVHWNTPHLLKEPLKKLVFDPKLQIIVIDNHSKESLSWIKKDFPSVELVENKNNYGYAFACNQGVIKSKGDWLLFLNPDVDINPKTISQMVHYATKNKLDACSPMVGDNYQKPLPSWLTLLIEFTPINKLFSFINFKNLITLKTLFGGCLLIRKKVLFDLGGWDERFFLWFEDSDLTKRLIENKYQIGWVKLAIKHAAGQSFNRLDNQTQRHVFFHSMEVFSRKHFSSWGKLIIGLIKKHYTSRKLLPVFNHIISITVPNANKKLLNLFFSQNLRFHTPGVREEWVVVSSAINNYEVWQWRKKYPFVRFIPIDKNYGFASTVNIGLRVSTGKWIGTVNDDVILSKDWLKNLLLNDQFDIGSINPVIKKKSGEIESIGIKVFSYGKALPITNNDNGINNERNPSRNRSIEIDATNAAAVIYNKKALNEVGLFDERFGSYLEDIDLSLRLSHAGYKNIVSLKSILIHIGQSSSKKLDWQKNWLDFKNWILVILKNWGIKKFIFNLPAIIIERLRNLSGIIKKL